jgi:hypothetical protein
MVVAACLVGPAAQGDDQTTGTSTTELMQRVAALENRVAALEEQVNALKKGAATSRPAAQPKAVVEITSPLNGEEIGMNVLVEGIIHVDDLGERTLVVAVHPIQTNRLWVQPHPLRIEKVEDGYRFRCRAYCGTQTQGIGEKFELYAMLAKKGAMKEGDQLDGIPKDVEASPSVLVTRKHD